MARLAALEVDNHVGVVDHVRHSALVHLVHVVYVMATAGVDADGLVLQDQPHQVKEVAALLHQGAAGPLGEAVPGVHFVKERETVLDDGEHVDVAELAARAPPG